MEQTNNRLFVYGIGKTATENDLLETFNLDGTITHARNTGKGYAFLTFKTRTDAENFLDEWNGKIGIDQKISVEFSTGPPDRKKAKSLWYHKTLRTGGCKWFNDGCCDQEAFFCNWGIHRCLWCYFKLKINRHHPNTGDCPLKTINFVNYPARPVPVERGNARPEATREIRVPGPNGEQIIFVEDIPSSPIHEAAAQEQAEDIPTSPIREAAAQEQADDIPSTPIREAAAREQAGPSKSRFKFKDKGHRPTGSLLSKFEGILAARTTREELEPVISNHFKSLVETGGVHRIDDQGLDTSYQMVSPRNQPPTSRHSLPPGSRPPAPSGDPGLPLGLASSSHPGHLSRGRTSNRDDAFQRLGTGSESSSLDIDSEPPLHSPNQRDTKNKSSWSTTIEEDDEDSSYAYSPPSSINTGINIEKGGIKCVSQAKINKVNSDWLLPRNKRRGEIQPGISKMFPGARFSTPVHKSNSGFPAQAAATATGVFHFGPTAPVKPYLGPPGANHSLHHRALPTPLTFDNAYNFAGQAPLTFDNAYNFAGQAPLTFDNAYNFADQQMTMQEFPIQHPYTPGMSYPLGNLPPVNVSLRNNPTGGMGDMGGGGENEWSFEPNVNIIEELKL